jgi:7-carboxy-7-deazaguanine synthase
LLAKDGVFPVTRDGEGHPLSSLPASGFPFPGTIQGEGKLAGVPSLFVRLAGCNLHCAWEGSGCDTAYAAQPEETRSLPVEEIARVVIRNLDRTRHVVITGGEPLLQAQGVAMLCRLLKERQSLVHVTIESNATLYDEEVTAVTDLASLSPKLSSSAPASDTGHHVTRLRPEVIQRYIARARHHGTDFQLKFVLAREEDEREIQELLAALHGWENEDVLIMPLGTTPDMVRRNALRAAGVAIKNGWRYCDRLHLALFGNKEGT